MLFQQIDIVHKEGAVPLKLSYLVCDTLVFRRRNGRGFSLSLSQKCSPIGLRLSIDARCVIVSILDRGGR